MLRQHPRLTAWQPPPTYQQRESQLEGITVFAPRPEVKTVDAVQSFKCPKCGASTQFDVAAGGVACEYCGHVVEVAAQQVGRQADEYEFTLETLQQAVHGWGVERELHCENCGAELTVAEGAITATCPFCASNKVNVRTAVADQLRPRFLAPFVLDEAAARGYVREWLGKGWMHPKALATAAGVHRLPGIYLPFWTFDTRIISEWRAEVGYPKTETYYDSSSKSFKTRTRIKWQWEQGRAQTIIDDLLLNGSSHVSQPILARIHPFDLQQLVDYMPDYLAGWQAHAYDVTLMDAWETGKETMRQQAKRDCYAQIESSHVRNFSMASDFADETWRYILLPVYLASYTFGGTVYQLMVNGQTGRVAGQKPVAWWKIWLVVAAIALPGLLLVLISLLVAYFSSSDLQGGFLLAMLGGGVLVAISLLVAYLLYTRAVALEAGL